MSRRDLMFDQRHCLGICLSGRFATSLPSSVCRSTLPTNFGCASFLSQFLIEDAASSVYPMLSKDPYLHQEALAVASAVAFRNSSTACTRSTDPTPALSLVLLQSLAISCFLLRRTGKFTWKYGEVHIFVRGSSPWRTGKFTISYGEVHFAICISTREAWISVRGSSHCISGGCTGKFTSAGPA